MKVYIAIHAGEFGHVYDVQAFSSAGARKAYVKKAEQKVGKDTYELKDVELLNMDDVTKESRDEQ